MFKKEALHLTLERWKKGGFTVRYWDGTERNYGTTAPRFKIIFTREPKFSASDLKHSLNMLFGTAYVNGTIKLEGSMDDIIRTAFQLDDVEVPYHLGYLRQEMILEKEKKDQENISAHYDLGNDFFKEFLDPTMTYSCAYFASPDDTLEEAQHHKIKRSLNKLQIRPGDTLLDIGCGWGEVIIEAARDYGARATGITLSYEQYNYVQERIKKEHLEDRVKVREMDYLDLDPSVEQFDRIISIGMMEHVGKKFLPLYVHKCASLLKPGGVFLLHSILNMKANEEESKDNWIKNYIFPGGYIPGIAETVKLFPMFGLDLLHFENLRMDYARTLHLWDENFRKNMDKLPAKYDDKLKKIWDLYLRGCESAFRTGVIDVGQFLLCKGNNNELHHIKA